MLAPRPLAEPRLQRVLAKLKKETLAPHLGGRYPGGTLARQGGAPLLRELAHLEEIAGRLDAREPDQRAYLAQALDQHRPLQLAFVPARRGDRPYLEVTRDGRGGRIG